MPIEQKAVGSVSKVSLDEKSARTLSKRSSKDKELGS